MKEDKQMSQEILVPTNASRAVSEASVPSQTGQSVPNVPNTFIFNDEVTINNNSKDEKDELKHKSLYFVDKHFGWVVYGGIILFLIMVPLAIIDFEKVFKYFGVDPQERRYLTCMNARGSDSTCSKIAGYK